MLSYRFRGLRLSENGDGFHGPIAVYITCKVSESRECRGRIQAGAGIAVKWRKHELYITSGMFGRDPLLRLDERPGKKGEGAQFRARGEVHEVQTAGAACVV